MYLSRVEIDIKNRAKIRELTHLGAYHNWVEQSFPNEINNQQRLRHLWRIDSLRNKKYLLILSESKPDVSQLEHYGVAGTAMIKSYEQFLANITENQIMRFRLVANPTYAVTKAGEKKHKIFPHITVTQQRQWLIERAKQNGFELLDNQSVESNQDNDSLAFDITGREYKRLYRKNDSAHKKSIRLSQVTFEGLLRVTDVAQFKEVLTHGIGREKAFGMGLITVIPEE